MSFVSLTPVIDVFIAGQKYLIHGIAATGLKQAGHHLASKEELRLELAEPGWRQGNPAIAAEARDADGPGPGEVTTMPADTIAFLPVFCALLTHRR